MNGHWVSGTRKLNHHYQSAAPSILRTYLLINDSQTSSSYRFTPNGLIISGVTTSRTFVRASAISIDTDYIPIMVLYRLDISADGVGFNLMDLENETFTNSRSLDVILRKENIEFTSVFDGSTFEVEALVFLINRAAFGLYTDEQGNIWYDSTTFSGLTFTFPEINTKVCEVDRKFNLLTKGDFYYQPACNATYYEYSTSQIATPKNLNSLTKGSYVFSRTYKVDKSEWERTYPRPYIADIYYGMAYSIRGDGPYSSVCPNMYNVYRGNYFIYLNGYDTVVSYSNKNGNNFVQTYMMPSEPEVKNGIRQNSLIAGYGETQESYSVNGNFLAWGRDGTTNVNFGALFSTADGEDWSLDLSYNNNIFRTLNIYTISYGAPDDGSGSSMSVSSFTDMWRNTWGSNA